MKNHASAALGMATCFLLEPRAAVAQAVRLGEVAGNSPRYLQVVNSASLRPAAVTLECWVRPAGAGYNDGGVGALLIGRPAQGGAGSFLVSWGLYYSPGSGHFYFEMAGPVFGTNGQGITSVGTVPIGGTAHVAVTYDGAAIKLYINGVLDAQTPATYGSFNYTRPDNVLIGAANYLAGFERRFNGTMDEVRIWSVARSAAQIADAKDARMCAGTPALVGNWGFASGTLLDTSGNGNNAAAVSAVSFASEVAALANAGAILVQPASRSACGAQGATFAVGAASPAASTYVWQVETATGVWAALDSGAVSLPCGGSVVATAPLSGQTGVVVSPCPGVSTYRVRCAVHSACGDALSDAASYTLCYANCDCSTAAPALNVLDFSCFLQKFAASNSYANCDNSTTAPTLNVLDLACFLQKFGAGCP